MNRNLESYQSDIEFSEYRVSDVNIITRDKVDLSGLSLVTLPHFKSIGGNLDCRHNQLTSLKGCPTYISGTLDCRYNQLTSLEGCPTSIGGGLYCYHNKDKLSCPKGVEIGGKFINS